MTFFSIIIPCYNSEATIERCINSLLDQTYTDFEIIIQDGRSKDNTIQIIQRFTDQRITIYSEEDEGVYDAMNKAIERANGQWLYFLGSNDWLFDRNVFSTIFSIIENSADKVIYGDVKLKGFSNWAKDGDVYRGQTSLCELLNFNICHQAIFYNKEVFNSPLPYNVRYIALADYDMNLFLNSKYNFQYVDRIICNFTMGGISNTVYDKNFEEERWINVVKYYGYKLIDKRFRKYKKHFKDAFRSLVIQGSYIMALKALIIYFSLKMRKL